MPAPKAVLRDINDFGLNPGVAYTITDTGGHLTATPKPGAKHAGLHINQRTLPVVEKPAQNALKALPKEEPKPEVKVEAKVEAPVEEITVIASSKKKVAAVVAPPAPEAPDAAAEAAKPVEKPTDEKPVS